MLIESGTTPNGVEWELLQGVNGSGGTIYTLFITATSRTSGRPITVMHSFDSEGEARAWVKGIA